jgi:Retroviral aspartyl protease.
MKMTDQNQKSYVQNIKNRKCLYEYNKIEHRIVTEIEISNPNNFDTSIQCKALWDTGADYCMVSEDIINSLDLSCMGTRGMETAGGIINTELYSIGVSIPNFASFSGILATKSYMDEYDLIIGMNLIKQGNFSINNYGGKTTVSFTYPPEKIDE